MEQSMMLCVIQGYCSDLSRSAYCRTSLDSNDTGREELPCEKSAADTVIWFFFY